MRAQLLSLITFSALTAVLTAEDAPKGRPAQFSLIAATDKLTYARGDRISLSIVIVNETLEDLAVFESLDGIELSVMRDGAENVDLRSERDRKLQSIHGGFIRQIPLRCGLRIQHDLNEAFDLTRPGRYTVEVRRHSRAGPRRFNSDPTDKRQIAAATDWIRTATEFTIK